RHRATGTPSSRDQTAGHLGFPSHRGHRNGLKPAAARYQAGRKPDHPRAASLPGSVPRAAIAQAPSADTFCPRTHSLWLSTSQENEGSGCRERYYRLRASTRQLRSDKLDRFFRGQPPREMNFMWCGQVRTEVERRDVRVMTDWLDDKVR